LNSDIVPGSAGVPAARSGQDGRAPTQYLFTRRKSSHFWLHPKANAGPQAPPMAAARYERRLLAVACRPMLGDAVLQTNSDRTDQRLSE
jgi:hypothetical protein